MLKMINKVLSRLWSYIVQNPEKDKDGVLIYLKC